MSRRTQGVLDSFTSGREYRWFSTAMLREMNKLSSTQVSYLIGSIDRSVQLCYVK